MQYKEQKLFFILLIFVYMLPTSIEAASAKFHVDVGLNHFYKKRFLEAYREFKAALDKDPKYAEAHYNLGRVYKAQGFIKEAIIEFQIALKLNPAYLAAQRELEAIKSTLEQDVRKQLKIQGQETVQQTEFFTLPADEAAQKGQQLLNQGKTSEAIHYFELALRQNPNNVQLLKIVAYLYFQQNNFKKALDYYSRARNYLPTNAEILYAIGLIYMKTHMPQKAEETFRQTLKLKPDLLKAVFALGEALEAQEKIEDAIFQFRKCLELSPKLQAAQDKLNYLVGKLSYNYFSRGSYFYQQGNYAKAESMLSLARTYGNLSEEQNNQIDEMLNICRFWINKQQTQSKISSEYQNLRNESYINKPIEVCDVSQNPKPYIGQAVIWSGRIEFVGNRKGKKYLFVNSRPNISLDNGMEYAFEIEFPKNLPTDPRIALGSEVTEVKGKILRVEKIRDQISGAFSLRRQPVIEATEIEIVRKNYEQPLIIRFY